MAGMPVPATLANQTPVTSAIGRTTQELGPAHAIDIAGTAVQIRRAQWNVYCDTTLEQWLSQCSRMICSASATFSPRRRATTGCRVRRGILAVGQPGTGKSLTAQATGAIFNVPLLRLEAGKIFGSLVGESERNWRSAFATARAIAPCILRMDEVDGLFSGAKSSGQIDGRGGGARDKGRPVHGRDTSVIKAILQDRGGGVRDKRTQVHGRAKRLGQWPRRMGIRWLVEGREASSSCLPPTTSTACPTR